MEFRLEIIQLLVFLLVLVIFFFFLYRIRNIHIWFEIQVAVGEKRGSDVEENERGDREGKTGAPLSERGFKDGAVSVKEGNVDVRFENRGVNEDFNKRWSDKESEETRSNGDGRRKTSFGIRI